MGDVRERAAVNEGGAAFDRLNEVRLRRFKEERHQSARAAHFTAGERCAVLLRRHDELIDAGAEVVLALREAEHGHQFRGHRDIETGFRRNAVRGAAETRHDEAEVTVIHVEHALPGDFLDVQLIAVAAVIKDRREEVVRRGDRVEVTGEVEVDRLHRENLGVAAASRAALHAEARAERRFAESEAGILPDLAEALGEGDRGRGLSGAGRHAGGRRHEDQFPVGLTLRVQMNLCLVAAVGFEFGISQTDFVRELLNRFQFDGMRDFNIRKHGYLLKRLLG